ncbi:MAG: ferredoxin [Actinomycetota bacterium]|nr:ferredoxin [Actinomycetota bacterium]
MRVVHNPDLCTGHGRCYALVSELFGDDEFGHGYVLGDGTLSPDQEAAARRAVAACPERAISLIDG